MVFVDRETSNVHGVFMADNKLNEKYVNHMDAKKKKNVYTKGVIWCMKELS